jgi:hypothetical protein
MDLGNLVATHLETGLRGTVYLATQWSLCLGGLALTDAFLPRSSRTNIRLAAVLLTSYALNATLVEGIGLVGWLRPGVYVVGAVAIGLGAVVAGSRSHLNRDLWRLFERGTHLWIHCGPFGLGFGAAAFLMLLLMNSCLVEGTDSLSMHGPWIVEWLQNQRVSLATQYNYPLVWELQFAPVMMLLRSDVLVIVPRALMMVAVLAVVSEAARALGLSGRSAQLVAWWCALCPMLWQDGSLKNDTIFAVGLMTAATAIHRLAQQDSRGGLFLLQLGVFFVLGTKGTGFVFAALCLAGGALVSVVRQPRPVVSRAAAAAALTLAVQLVPASVQIANLFRHGNPVYPVAVSVFGTKLLRGTSQLAGTSILEHAGDADTWTYFVSSASRLCGPEFLMLALLVMLACAHAGVVVSTSRPPESRWRILLIAALAVCVLWLMYLRTPWTRGPDPDHLGFVKTGLNLRFATAQVFLSYAVAAAWLHRVLHQRVAFRLLSGVTVGLIVVKWVGMSRIFKDLGEPQLYGAYAALVVVAVLLWTIRWRTARTRRPPTVLWILRVGLVTIAVMIWGAHVDWKRAESWAPICREVWSHVWAEVPSGSTIALNKPNPNYRYLLYGRRLDNRLLAPTRAGPARQQAPDSAGYVFFKRSRRTKGEDTTLLEWCDRNGWTRVGSCEQDLGILLARP